MNRLHRMGAAVTAIAAVLAFQPQLAHASAFGFEPVPAFPISYKGVSIPVPKGQLSHGIEGDHRNIKMEFAQYTVAPSHLGLLAGRACNWRIDFQYKDLNGKVYRTNRGPTEISCNFTARRTVHPGELPHYGKACAKLYVHAQLRATQCHAITKPSRLF